MESFFRRMSSIVRRNSNKSFEPDENEQESNGRARHFREMQQRRRSAPDIHRRAPPADKTSMEPEKKITSSEAINSQNLPAQSSTTNLTLKQYSSTGKLSLFNSLN
jgi:hypothetical protein